MAVEEDLETDVKIVEGDQVEPKVGLALSGRSGWEGFHLGALLRLNELGLLKRLDVISAASGSERLACNLALGWPQLEFDEERKSTNFREIFVGRGGPQMTSDVPGGRSGKALAGMLWRTRRLLPLDAKACRRFADLLLQPAATLRDLPEPPAAPELLLSMISWQTGSVVLVDRNGLADRRVGRLRQPDLELSQIVAAGEGLPVRIDCDATAWSRIDQDVSHRADDEDLQDLFPNRGFRSSVVLSTESVLATLGVPAMLGRANSILVSDAMGSFVATAEPIKKFTDVFARGVGLAVRDATIRRRKRVAEEVGPGRSSSLWNRTVSWEITRSLSEYELDEPIARDTDETTGLGGSTGPIDRGLLINWGYVQADAALHQSGLDEGFPRPTEWPVPEAAPHDLLRPS